MKKIAIMQPYFFPYLGYFSMMKHTEKWIVFDVVQFIRHGWIERNRILHPNPEKEWQYIKVPLIKQGRDTNIIDVKIDNSKDWKKTIISQLTHYKKKAKFYYPTIKLVNDCFSIETDSITKLNAHIHQVICDYLSISLNQEIFSEMNLRIEEATAPDEWALNICKEIEYKHYINSIGGTTYFDKNKYDNANIKLNFIDFKNSEYKQKNDKFISGLSIIDALMFNSPEEINDMLDKYELV